MKKFLGCLLGLLFAPIIFASSAQNLNSNIANSDQTQTTTSTIGDGLDNFVLTNPNNNDFARSLIGFNEVSSVDPYSGVLHAYIPLIHIPENDNADLEVGFSLINLVDTKSSTGTDWSTTLTPTQGFVIYVGFLGITGMSNTATFLDPSGKEHVFYGLYTFNPQVTSVASYSKDHWKAVLSWGSKSTAVNGTVYAPDGTRYIVSNNRVTQVISKNSGTVIDYGYSSCGAYSYNLSQISVNNGLIVNL